MSNPIQGNERFTKVSNTVLSTVAVEDALDNANILVTRVAKGFANIVQVNASGISDNNVYSSLPTDPSKPETGTLLILPNGALITNVTLFKPNGSKFAFITTDGGEIKLYRNNNVTSKFISATKIFTNADPMPDFPQKFVANNFIGIQTSESGFNKQNITIDMVTNGDLITPGVLGVEFEYIMPLL